MSNHASKGTALITGASTGIGAVYADRLAKRGFRLDPGRAQQDKLNDVARRVQSTTGRKVEALQADLTLPADVKRVADPPRHRHFHHCVGEHAGVAAAGKLLESDPNYLDQMIQLNVTALTRLALAAAPGFRSARERPHHQHRLRGGARARALNGTYSGTKAYVQNFSTSLKNELADKGRDGAGGVARRNGNSTVG